MPPFVRYGKLKVRRHPMPLEAWRENVQSLQNQSRILGPGLIIGSNTLAPVLRWSSQKHPSILNRRRSVSISAHGLRQCSEAPRLHHCNVIHFQNQMSLDSKKLIWQITKYKRCGRITTVECC
jgi:hypothetical protein